MSVWCATTHFTKRGYSAWTASHVPKHSHQKTFSHLTNGNVSPLLSLIPSSSFNFIKFASTSTSYLHSLGLKMKGNNTTFYNYISLSILKKLSFKKCWTSMLVYKSIQSRHFRNSGFMISTRNVNWKLPKDFRFPKKCSFNTKTILYVNIFYYCTKASKERMLLLSQYISLVIFSPSILFKTDK